MKILMILSNSVKYDPRVYNEAQSLISAGHQVHMICWTRNSRGDRSPQKETFDSMTIHYIDDSTFMTLLKNPALKNPFWWQKACQKAAKLHNGEFTFDAVHCHDLDTLPAGVWLKKKLKVKLVYDAHEIFGYMIEQDTARAITTAAFALEKYCVKYTDHLITVNEAVKNYLASISSTPCAIVMNCKNISDRTYHPPAANIFTISYIGILHKNRMFPELIDIIGKLDRVKFIMAGFGKKTLIDAIQKKSAGYDNVEFIGRVSSQEVLSKTLGSNAIICLLNPKNRNNQAGLPNKVFEAMVTGRPIIATKGLYYSGIIERNDLGITTNYDPSNITDAVVKLRDDPRLCERLGRNGLKAALEKYNWENEEKKLLEVYRNLASV